MKKFTLIFIGLALLVIAGCSSTPAEPEALVLAIEATDIAYDVQEIRAQVGQPIHLTFYNMGTLEHDFSIMAMPLMAMTGEMSAEEMEEDGHDMEGMEEPDVHVSAAVGGGTRAIQFTPAEAGEYSYFCTVPGHKEAGMAGTLIVTAP